MISLSALQKDLKKAASKEKSASLSRFFKTGEGEYGFGDIFLGLSVPQSRILALKYKDLTFLDIATLLKSKVHEERLIALLILVDKFDKEPMEQRHVYDFYLKNTKYVNNWDLVDLSSDKIVGEYLIDKPKDVLLKLAKSKNIWERRIAIVSTYTFIKNKKFDLTFKIADLLIEDKEDLIQKAMGWMLREVGNRDLVKQEKFLKNRYKKMGRTALRYAVEKFPENKRKKYLNSQI